MTLFCFIRQSSKLSYFLFILVGGLIFLLCAQNAHATQVTLAWDPNTEPELAGYNLYYGTSSGDYSQVIDVGNVANYTVFNLTDGLTYYFAVTAYDSTGYESDYSNEVSTTFIKVTSPNGAEVIPSGSIYPIYWVASPEAVNFKLKYSLDNGRTWIQEADNIGGTSYGWRVPIPLKNKRRCLIRVVGYDESGTMIGKDISDAPFTIEVVRLTSPNGGNTLTSGTQYTIRWTTNATINAVEKVELYYKKDGTTWYLIETITGSNPGSYNWKVPTVITTETECKVKVLLSDTSGNLVGRDLSDSWFIIRP